MSLCGRCPLPRLVSRIRRCLGADATEHTTGGGTMFLAGAAARWTRCPSARKRSARNSAACADLSNAWSLDHLLGIRRGNGRTATHQGHMADGGCRDAGAGGR